MSTTATKPSVLYFGCIGRSGHYMYRSGGGPIDWNVTTPWGKTPDGSLLDKKGPQLEGRAVIHHKDGWTALSFWDRSVDHRGNSNSNFFVADTLNFDEMVALTKERFPEVWSRLSFDVVDAATEASP